LGKDYKKSGNPLFSAAVLKEQLRRRSVIEPAPRLANGAALPGPTDGIRTLYEGVLRDLGVTDAQVEEYLAAHRPEVEAALRGHGRRGG
jgi:hypothetical protein